MKTKITLVLILLFTLVSCSKWQGSGPSEDVEPTAENSIFEGDFYAAYLDFEKENLGARQEELNAIINGGKGTSEDKAELEQINNKLATNKVELSNIERLNRIIGGRRGPIPPIPPCPRGRCDGLPDGLFYIISEIGAKAKVTFLDKNLKRINNDNPTEPIGFKELENLLSIQNVSNLQKFSGEVVIQVERLSSQGEPLTYRLEASFK